MILCCGEALIDMIPTTTADGTKAYVPCTGGAVFNTGIALGRLGVSVSLLSGVSRDDFGQLLADTLTQNNVDTSLLVRSDRLSTLAVVHLKDGSATYSFYDENSAGRMLATVDMPDMPRSVQALFFGGISLVSEPAADAYADFLAHHARNHVVYIDPNIRPGFIKDEVRYRARLARMIGLSDIIKVSDDDLDWLVDGDGSIKDKAADILAQGPQFVIVTLGAEGAVAYGPDGSLIQAPVAVKVADTVGAGDTFNAGVLATLDRAGLLDKATIRQMPVVDLAPALALAAKAAAVTVSRVGADPPRVGDLL